MAVEAVYGGVLDQAVGAATVVILDPQPGGDSTPQLQGSRQPYTDPDIVCDGLQALNASPRRARSAGASSSSPMPRAPTAASRLRPDGDLVRAASGYLPRATADHFPSSACAGAADAITLDFGASALTIGRDLYGARVVDGGDGSGPSVTVSLLPLKQCLGMYKDPSCNNAFGFTGVADKPLRRCRWWPACSRATCRCHRRRSRR